MTRPFDKSGTSDTHVYPRFTRPDITRLFMLYFGMGLIAATGGISAGLIWLSPWMSSTGLAALASGLTVAVILGWPIWMMRRHYRAILTAGRAARLGFGFSLGIFGIPLLISTITVATDLSFAMNWGVLGGELLGITVIVILFAIAWRILQRWLPDLVRQDGARCPHCGYCVLAIQSMRCPECGRAFTFEDLETTEHEFSARSQRVTSE